LAESPVVFHSVRMHYFLLCVTLIAWGLLGLDSAEYSLPVLSTDPVRWGMTCFYNIGGISLSVLILAWAMKLRVVYIDTTWETRSRELSFDEYTQITKEYGQEYRHMMQRCDWPTAIVALSIAIATGTFPFLTMTAVPVMALLSPYLFALLLILLGLTLARLFYQIAPNSAVRHFRYVSPRELRRGRALFDEIPAFSWRGIAVDICEASGFYRIGSPVVAGRIRGMEAAALVTAEMDSRGQPFLARSKLKAHGGSAEETLQRSLCQPEHLGELKSLVIDTILKYLEGVDDPSLVTRSLIELGALAEEPEEADSKVAARDETVLGDDEAA